MTLSPRYHYETAELLLDEGREVVDKIGETAGVRDVVIEQLTGEDGVLAYATDGQQAILNALTGRMDELGKKAMGIWAQAQAHATLATVPWVEAP